MENSTSSIFFDISEENPNLLGVKLRRRVISSQPRRGPWGALSPMPEINAISVDSESGSVFTAAGDSSAYCWDVGYSDYLHCVISRSSASQAKLCTLKGFLLLCQPDCKTGKCIKVIGSQDKKFRFRISFMVLDGSES
ncbi:hypothetical protein EUTSA_v10023917mg [Eutrema salsugineum]|uniref:Uncharacterized protein n=1 Tax=Eutrema salsugineum TaxID=72664 RepID=V4JVJ9_EUTSA|nr:hypothetical protein EUTSA_v10023917mg [Eutrema salsugineum]